MTLYEVRCEAKCFKKGDIVRTIDTSFTGNCDFVENINDPSKKGWMCCHDMQEIKEK